MGFTRSFFVRRGFRASAKVRPVTDFSAVVLEGEGALKIALPFLVAETVAR